MIAVDHGGGLEAASRGRVGRALGRFATVVLLAGAGVAPSMASASAADDAAAYVLSDVHCSPGGDGVLDLTLVNDGAAAGASFVIDDLDAARHRAAESAAVLVAPSSAHALAFTGLADGEIEVPVTIDGVASRVHAVIDCDLPRLTSRLSSTAVAGSAPVDTPELPRTGGDSGGFVTGGLLVAAGIAVSLLARRRYS